MATTLASSADRVDAVAHNGDFVTSEWAGVDGGAHAIHSAIRVIAAAVQADSAWLVCCAGEEEPVATAQVGDLPDDEQLRESLALSLVVAAEGEARRGIDGSLYVPVTTGHAQLRATLALAWHDAESASATCLLLPQATELLEHVLRAVKPPRARPRARGRARAYEALVEIGTQIQAQEAHADVIFQSIVEHARSLLGTDVAWLGLISEHDQQRMRIAVAAGASTAEFMDMEVQVGMGIGGLALQEGRAVAMCEPALSGKNCQPR